MPGTLAHASLGTLAAAVRRRLKQVVWTRLAAYDLTPQQFWVILILHEQGPSSLHPLAQQVWMDDPTASRVVKAMAARGWLTTRPDPKHGRRILIDLAPSARPLALELKGLSDRIREALVAGLSPETQAVVREGLLGMLTNLEDMAAAPLDEVDSPAS